MRLGSSLVFHTGIRIDTANVDIISVLSHRSIVALDSYGKRLLKMDIPVAILFIH